MPPTAPAQAPPPPLQEAEAEAGDAASHAEERPRRHRRRRGLICPPAGARTPGRAAGGGGAARGARGLICGRRWRCTRRPPELVQRDALRPLREAAALHAAPADLSAGGSGAARGACRSSYTGTRCGRCGRRRSGAASSTDPPPAAARGARQRGRAVPAPTVPCAPNQQALPRATTPPRGRAPGATSKRNK